MVDNQALAELERANTAAAYDAFWQQVGPTYDQTRRAFYRAVTNAIAGLHPRPRPLSILDVGCGPGYQLAHVQQFLPGYRLTLTGVDWSAVAVEQARVRVEATYHVGVWPLSLAQRYDVVICEQTLEHVAHPLAFAKALLEVCAPAGHVLITVPNGATDDYIGHRNFWDEPALRAFLEQVGTVAALRPFREGANWLADVVK